MRNHHAFEEEVFELDVQDEHEISRHQSRGRGREEKGEGRLRERKEAESLKCGMKLVAQWRLCVALKQVWLVLRPWRGRVKGLGPGQGTWPPHWRP